LGEIGSQPALDALQQLLPVEADAAVRAEIEAAIAKLKSEIAV
jgi:hypothetical protein